MEIMIALLILIGAWTVGSNSSISEETQSKKQLARSEHVITESGVDISLGPCRLPNGQLAQRDLTAKRSPAIPSLNDATRKALRRCPNE
ncbi:MAG: hypothetical protein H6963_11805 [Chromatiaceae bacterium]|nr:hypothetical protein [Chromatiaceae bacterium]